MAPVGRILRSARLTRPLVARNQRGGEQEGARDVHGHQGRHHRHRRSDLQGRRPDRGRAHRRDRPEPHGRHRARRDRCYVMPGGIDPHTHLEMPFMGTYCGRRFRERHARGALRRHDDGGRFRACPAPDQALLDALQTWDNKARRRRRATIRFHMAITWWGEQVFDGDGRRSSTRGINTFKHFMAYKGALMVNDDEMFASFQRCAELGALPLVHAENGDVVAALQQKLHGRGQHRAGGPCLFAPAGGGGRGDQPRHHDRRHGRRAALRRAHLLRAGARGDPPGPRRRACASMASR